ncbi:MAG TPA: stage III sporulation protein AA [Candidatus Lachnoclostridium stercorigallinarum]|uniref:Stage III sporulation protein AA n=1 Tax=Candidatus Lachnoclostridium stercorigallinarum TaxID=2838634 RepID=A0A9D2K632_9FIRM|nr:stage III sporulation protein AA [Candidatus Lachnoclostridium stercorigallinarum]
MESDEWTRIFGKELRGIFEGLEVDFEKLQEVRLRVGQPVCLWYENQEYLVGGDGRLGQAGGRERSDRAGRFEPRTVTDRELRETVECMGNYSLYAFEEEIRQGFLTVRGGHRVGLAGKVVMEEGRIKTIRHISGVNIRFAHQVKGCGAAVLPSLLENGRLLHSLLISPPRGGKTTLLRDLVRLLSDGADGRPGINVSVIDERSEIAACCQGIPQNDLGARTDVLDGCPKALGMMMAIRALAPAAVAVDEIGGKKDLEAVEYAAGCGCSVLATVHGSGLEEIRRKPAMKELIDQGIFRRFVILGGGERAGTVKEVLDEKGNLVGKGGDGWSG